MADYVRALNTLTGKVTSELENIVHHFELGRYFVEVDDDFKPYVEGMFKPQTADEWKSSHPNGEKTDEEISAEEFAENGSDQSGETSEGTE